MAAVCVFIVVARPGKPSVSNCSHRCASCSVFGPLVWSINFQFGGHLCTGCVILHILWRALQAMLVVAKLSLGVLFYAGFDPPLALVILFVIHCSQAASFTVANFSSYYLSRTIYIFGDGPILCQAHCLSWASTPVGPLCIHSSFPVCCLFVDVCRVYSVLRWRAGLRPLRDLTPVVMVSRIGKPGSGCCGISRPSCPFFIRSARSMGPQFVEHVGWAWSLCRTTYPFKIAF